MKMNIKKNKMDILFILPAIIFIVLFTYMPLMQLIRYSFTNWNLLSDNYKFVGLKNYEWLFVESGSKYLWNSLKVTIIYTLGTMFITVIGGMLLALLFRKKYRMFNFLRPIMFLPRDISFSSAAIIFLWILNTNNGILNKVLEEINLSGQDWLGNSIWALLSIIMISGWKNIGYGMLIYLASMANIPREYYEVAQIDGAGKISQFFNVTLPALIPTILFLMLTSFMTSMKAFQTVDIMTEGGPFRTTEVFVYLIYRYAMVDFRVGRAAAASVIFFIILGSITLTGYMLYEKIKNKKKVF